METKLKNMSYEEIKSKEAELMSCAAAKVEEYNSKFEEKGYFLSYRFMSCTEYTDFVEIKEDTVPTYNSGYDSKIQIFVKRPKTNEELEELENMKATLNDVDNGDEEKTTEDDESNIDNEVSEDEEVKEEELSRDDDFINNKTCAFTEITLVHIYKSFWTSKIVFTDELDQIGEDLEFYLEEIDKKLAEKEEVVSE